MIRPNATFVALEALRFVRICVISFAATLSLPVVLMTAVEVVL